MLLRHQDPDRAPILQLAQGPNALLIAAQTPLRLLGELDLSDQVAARRVPSWEFDAGCLADQAASSVAPDDVLRPQRPSVGQLDVHAGVALLEPRYCQSAIGPDRQLVDPAGDDALDIPLPERETIRVTGGKVAHVQTDPGIARDLSHLSRGKEPISDATLIEHLDRP